jgi:lysophospholipase L1-like esterase
VPRGKHAAPRRRPRARALALTVVAGASVLGLLVTLRALMPPPSTASQAQIVSSTRTPGVQQPPPRLERLVVYGHSMAAGGGASDPSRGYAARTADAIGVTLLNRAEGGTIAAAAARSLAESPGVGPQDAVVIHTGMNDVLRRGDKAVSWGRAEIRRLLDGTADAGRRVVVLECQPASWRATPARRDRQAVYEAWNRMLRDEVVDEPGVAVLDTCESWNAQRYTDDSRYHPNDAGHALIAAQLVGLLARP